MKGSRTVLSPAFRRATGDHLDRDFPALGLPPAPRGRVFAPPRTPHDAFPSSSHAAQARPAPHDGIRRTSRSDCFRFAHIAGGEPFSADPGDEVLRLTPNARADPASPRRLAVCPRPNGAIVGSGCGGGMREDDLSRKPLIVGGRNESHPQLAAVQKP